jgi:hypothetical protein
MKNLDFRQLGLLVFIPISIIILWMIPIMAKSQTASATEMQPMMYVLDTNGDKAPDWAGTKEAIKEFGYENKPIITVIVSTDTDSINFMHKGHHYALLPAKPRKAQASK